MIRKIINAMIYDGTGAEPFLGCVEIKEGKISRIIHGPSRETGSQVIDAKGKALTPGFVDIHRHHDLAALFDPDFGKLELAQGITSAVAGNCGLGAFPNQPSRAKEQFAYIEPCLGKVPEGCTMSTFAEFMDALGAKKLPINVASLTGVGANATAVMGYQPRGFTDQERAEAVRLVEDAMKAGAVGLSFGIMYTPECYLSHQDFTAMAKKCAEYGGIMCTHIRGEGDSLVESVKEVIGIAGEAGCPLNISHFKATGVRNWGSAIGEAIGEIEKARAEGQIVTCDAYPYTGGATTALSLIPPSVLEGHDLAWLGTQEGGRKLADQIMKKQPGWDNMVESIGWERVVIGSVNLEKNRCWCGKNVQEIADQLGLDDPAPWFGSLVAEEEGKVGITIMSMSQDDVDRVLSLPYCAVISDSLYGGGDSPHPRLYGSFPRVIREYVNERHIMTLTQAIHKMTGMPAARVGLKGRGLIREGYAADLNVFDPAKIRDTATYTQPKQLAAGIDYTLLAGQIVARDNIKEEESFGRLLRKQ